MNRRIAMGYVVAGFIVAGCGSGDESDSFKLVPATGTVKYGGKPLEGALVVFTPDPKNKPSTYASGVTGADGHYSLEFRGRSGVGPGKYVVAVTKTIGGAASSDGDAMATAAAQSKGQTGKDAKDAPPKPAKIEGQFTADVKDSGGEFPFDIPAGGK
jgi:hypothetical protein